MGVAATLRLLNDPAASMRSHGLYRETLTLGAVEEQPGLETTLAWHKRNLGICANLLQTARSGDRVIVFFGAGHLTLLQQCVSETPGYVLVVPGTICPTPEAAHGTASTRKTDRQVGPNGAPGRIRTCDHPLRRRVLYPAELRARDAGSRSLRE